MASRFDEGVGDAETKLKGQGSNKNLVQKRKRVMVDTEEEAAEKPAKKDRVTEAVKRMAAGDDERGDAVIPARSTPRKLRARKPVKKEEDSNDPPKKRAPRTSRKAMKEQLLGSLPFTLPTWMAEDLVIAWD